MDYSHDHPAEPNLDEDFSLTQRQTPTPLPVRGKANRAITFLRFIIWISPGPAYVMIILLNDSFSPLPPLAVILICILITLFIGICDAFFSEQVPKKNGTPEWRPTLGHSFVFLTLQFFIAPLTVIVLLLGFCAFIVAANA